jgi:hypothetical protein
MALAVIALALVMKAIIPAGYMLDQAAAGVEGKVLTVRICEDAADFGHAIVRDIHLGGKSAGKHERAGKPVRSRRWHGRAERGRSRSFGSRPCLCHGSRLRAPLLPAPGARLSATAFARATGFSADLLTFKRAVAGFATAGPTLRSPEENR